jgi:hypothetical protein
MLDAAFVFSLSITFRAWNGSFAVTFFAITFHKSGIYFDTFSILWMTSKVHLRSPFSRLDRKEGEIPTSFAILRSEILDFMR